MLKCTGRVTSSPVPGCDVISVEPHHSLRPCLLQPHRKKKAFIEKKKAVTFHLVHRSQRDPLAADETAPQHVLLPAAAKVRKRGSSDRHRLPVPAQ